MVSVRHQLQGETNSTTELVASEFGSERVVYGLTQLIDVASGTETSAPRWYESSRIGKRLENTPSGA